MNIEILHYREFNDAGKMVSDKFWSLIETPTGFYRAWGKCGRPVTRDHLKKDPTRKIAYKKRSEKLKDGYRTLDPSEYDEVCPGFMDQIEGEILMFVMNNEIND